MIKVNVRNGNIEGALKTLKRKVRNTKQTQAQRDNKEYTKPSTERRAEKKKAIYKEQKRVENEEYYFF